MDRFEEMDNVLKLCKQLCVKHPDAVFSRAFFEKTLRKYGLKSNNGESVQYDDYFEYWEQRYKSVSNIKVYKYKPDDQFLQFDNDHYSINHIKIYLSIPASAIEKSVDIIFDYLSQNNIGHLSKVAKSDRSDVLVLRIEKEEDVPKVLSFINNNPLIKQNARLTSPFTMRAGVCGITFDGMLSYNRFVSLMLANYFTERQHNNGASLICLNDFINYINDYYNKTFVDYTDLKSFMDQEDVQKEIEELKEKGYEKHPTEKVLITYMYMLKVLMLALNSKTTYQDFSTEFKSYNNNIKDENYINDFTKILSEIVRIK